MKKPWNANAYATIKATALRNRHFLMEIMPAAVPVNSVHDPKNIG